MVKIFKRMYQEDARTWAFHIWILCGIGLAIIDAAFGTELFMPLYFTIALILIAFIEYKERKKAMRRKLLEAL